MDLFKIFIATMVATSAMTAFSYLMSKTFDKLYKEPVLLTYILKLLRINLGNNKQKWAGWVLHYLIGFGFVLLYDVLWRYKIEFKFLSTFVFGTISGIIGIIGWVIMFRISGFRLNLDYKGYYLQLFLAHIIFAYFVMIVYIII